MADEERLIVKPYNPRRERQKLILSAGLIIASLFVGLLLGGQWFKWQMVAKRQLEADHSQLQKQQKALQQQLSTAELNSEVDRSALETVRAELSELQGQLADTREELSFYRNLLQQEGVAQGLMISDLVLSSGETGDLNTDSGSDSDSGPAFNYRLVIQQRAGKLKTIKVTASIQVMGQIGDNPAVFTLKELDKEQQKDTLAMQFRYFYVHDGVLVLPGNFQPSRVIVQAWPAGQKKKSIERQFEWHLEAVSSER